MTTLTEMPTYEAYKDSGVDWIGDVPESWDISRLGVVFEERRTKVSDIDYPPLSVTKNGILPQLDNAAKTKDGDNRKLVLTGDFVINSRSDRKGSSGVSCLDGSVSLINIVLKPKRINPSFCNHLLKCNAFIEEYYRVGRGIVADLWTTRYDEMRTMMLALPSLNEQTAIANFLDEKTAKIDEAIAIKEKQIELLKERKQIIIQQAVTQGLDSTVPMKNSGVEWIGMIPEHWEVKKLKHVAHDFMYGTSVDCNQTENGIPVLRIPNIDELIVDFSDLKYTSLPVSETKKYLLKNNDILIVRTNGNPNLVGKSALFKGQDDFIYASYLIRVKPKKNIKPEFLINALNSFSMRGSLTYSARTSAGNYNLNTQSLGDCFLAYPPENEQVLISEHIKNQSKKFNEAETLELQQIEALKEYKTTLINSAVTGKIKVV